MYLLKPRFAHVGALLASASLAVALVAAVPARSFGQSLRGSMASLDRQNRVAREHAYTFIDNAARVEFFASQGWLVRMQPTADFVLRAVSFPYARPEVDLFIRRLAAQYRSGCGARLVVTSLTRPTTGQPRNASDRSVHPTGMALDLRRPSRGSCRTWLERVLLDLERAGVIEATLERFPVHYHIAVYPRQYAAYVEALEVRRAAVVHEKLAYRVRQGDSLWTIARTHGTTVDEIRSANQLDSSRIYVGQVLDVPLDE